MTDSELKSTLSYGKIYYENNKQRIKSQMMQKEQCQLCQRKVNHQNMNRHKQSKLCMNNRRNTSSSHEIQLEDLMKKMNNLENLIKIKELE